MSTDQRVAPQLVKTLEDGRLGSEQAAERLQDPGRADLAAKSRYFAVQHSEQAPEIRWMAASHGDEIEACSRVPGVLLRGFGSRT